MWVAGIALWFALRAYMERSPREQPSGTHRSWMASGILALTITAALLAGSIFLDTYKAHVVAGEIERARDQASKAVSALEGERLGREAAIQQLRQQNKLEVDTLQHEIDQLRRKQTALRP